jgi:hypothetical protein
VSKYELENAKKRLNDLNNAQTNDAGDYVIGFGWSEERLTYSQLLREIREAEDKIRRLQK